MNQVSELKKPILLRAIFIMNGLLMFLPFFFYYAITSKILDVGGELDPMWMIYTGIAYIALFATLVFCILKRNIMGVRAVLIITLLASLPASAYIGIVVSLISLALSFTAQVKAYFGA